MKPRPVARAVENGNGDIICGAVPVFVRGHQSNAKLRVILLKEGEPGKQPQCGNRLVRRNTQTRSDDIGADVGSVEIQRATLLDKATADMTYERAQRLAALETLKRRYRPSHPKLRAAEGELAILEGAIEERRDGFYG